MGYNSFDSYSMKIICIFMCVLAAAISAQNTRCPFPYMYHFGDGVTDTGNSVLIRPWGPKLPPARPPYGSTFPGSPNGRWSDGLIDFDFAAIALGFPVLTPYLSRNFTSSNGVIFSVARSPVLERKFFTSRGIEVPPYVVSLNGQLRWFKEYLKSVCKTPSACAERLRNSLILLGDIEGNDIGYPLSQGKSIKEVQTYVPLITKAQIDVTRELIKMGSNLIVVPATAPIGCFPYILTALPSNDSTAYDNLGCLKSVNDLVAFKNNDLQRGIDSLRREFPGARILYGAFDEGVIAHLEDRFNTRGFMALKACCGIGGKYHYDSKRFCGSPGVPVCSNPKQHIFWDGLHFTEEASRLIVEELIHPTLVELNCTSSSIRLKNSP